MDDPYGASGTLSWVLREDWWFVPPDCTATLDDGREVTGPMFLVRRHDPEAVAPAQPT